MQKNRTLIQAVMFFSLLFHASAFAQSTYLKVGEAKVKKSVLAIIAPNSEGPQQAKANLIAKTIQDDLEFVDFFSLIPASTFPQSKIGSAEEIKYGDWIKAGVDYLSFATLSIQGDRATLEFHLASAGGNKEVFAKRYTADTGELKILSHTVANDIVQNITGKRGIFLTKLAFQCNKSGKKELYTTNFDGSDVRQITRLRSTTLSPAWSPDGSKLAFSVYNRHSGNIKNLDLFEYNFKSGAIKLLSNRKGINSGASYAPSGDRIAYTMSYTGNPELHILDLATHDSTQLTRSIGFDVDPAFSPDGKQLAFVSSRAGKPMVYLLNVAAPSEVKRLTYAGQYNATPNWSPDGKKIVFAGWLDKHFDIFTITPDGAKIDRLSKDEGNNEDPNYSPDGNFIVFSSTRSGGKNIFIMNTDGGGVKRLTFGMGECVSPKWSPFL
jgi:TolB protein